MVEPRPKDDPDSRPVPDPTELTRLAVKEAVERAQEYTDGKMEVLEERLRGIDKASVVLHETVTRTPTDIQQAVGHLRELTDEKFAAVDAVLDEQRRGVEVAEQEREKAARALRIELNRAIEEGDRALRDHIQAQVAQIQASLTSAELLAQERGSRAADQVSSVDETAHQHVEQLRRERELVTAAQQEAISKAEVAAAKQFDEFSKAVTLQLDAMRLTMQDLTRRMDKTLS